MKTGYPTIAIRIQLSEYACRVLVAILDGHWDGEPLNAYEYRMFRMLRREGYVYAGRRPDMSPILTPKGKAAAELAKFIYEEKAREQQAQ